MDVRATLTEPGRSWIAKPQASEQAIEHLRNHTPGSLPDEYTELLRYSNGGEGPLALPPLYFMLYEAEYASELNQSAIQRDSYPGFFVFGSNGGLEAIAFDMRGKEPWPIVMYDPIAGTDSSETIAQSMSAFIQAIGIENQQ